MRCFVIFIDHHAFLSIGKIEQNEKTYCLCLTFFRLEQKIFFLLLCYFFVVLTVGELTLIETMRCNFESLLFFSINIVPRRIKFSIFAIS